MALSNAERQKRHRQRLKTAAASLRNEDGDDVLKELLIGTYFAAGRALLARHDSDVHAATQAEFEAMPHPTTLDLMEIMERAGQEAADDILKRKILGMGLGCCQAREEPPAVPARRRSRRK